MSQKEPNILIIDTSTQQFSLALMVQGNIVSEYLETETQSHAKKLTVEINNLLEKSHISFRELSAIAINEGPGSFTGLRVASSCAKGLAFSLNIPIIAIRGIEEYAINCFSKESNYTDVFILINARRNNYFYTQAHLGNILTPITFESLEQIEKSVETSEKSLVIKSEDEGFYNVAIAKFLAKSALEKYEKKDFVDLMSFEPNYYLNTYLKK